MTTIKFSKTEKRNIKRVQWIVDNFLEQWDIIIIKSRQGKLGQDYMSKIEINLFGEKKITSEYSFLVLHDYLQTLVEFWERFKVGIHNYRNPNNLKKYQPTDIISLIYGKLDIIMASHHGHLKLGNDSFILSFLDLPSKTIRFKDHRDPLMQFKSLLEGVPLDIFRECSHAKCSKWFATTNSRKIFCCNNCAANFGQYQLTRNPQKEKAYERKKAKQREKYKKANNLQSK